MKLLVLDGNSILNRAFYGIKILSTKEGIFTNGIYGFLTMLEKLKDETSPDAIAIAFDLKAPTFRHLAYEGYKANRKGMPSELAMQMPILKDLLKSLGYTLVECEGFEADDILGTLASHCNTTGDNCIIATGDKDSLQLVSSSVNVRIAATKFGRPEVTLYDLDKIKEVYGVTPNQLIDIKALQGDTSDNIPGVAGIGQKGATDLIQKFGSIEYIYNNIDTIDVRETMRVKLKNGFESAKMSKMLGTISTQAPIELDIQSYIPKKVNNSEAIAIMKKLEFFNLIEKMKLKEDTIEDDGWQIVENFNEPFESESKNNHNFLFEYIKNPEVNSDFINQLTASGNVYCTFGDTVISKKEIETNIYFITESNVFEFETNNSDLIKIFNSLNNVTLHTYNCKEIYAYCFKNDIDLSCTVFDCMLSSYILNCLSTSYELEKLNIEYGTKDVQIKADNVLDEKKKTLSNVAKLKQLSQITWEQIEQNNQHLLLTDIEIPLAKVLAQMEQTGFSVDSEGVAQYGSILELKIDMLQREIFESIGYEFNINSPKQLGVALFEKLMLPAGKKTKTGYSTNAEVLEGLRNTHPSIDKILEYRTLSKLKSTYCDGLLKVIGKDGRIHTIFNQVETRTGRLSSIEPNLQNIPVRTDVGKELRRFFVTEQGWTLIDADYSQIELRVLADISKDENMIKAFNEGIDIHATTASQVFNLPLEMISSTLRSRAKAVNFGIVYGISAFSLAKDIGVSRAEADAYIKGYLELYTGVDSFMKEAVEKAKINKYAQTTFGRRRALPEITASNFNLRSFGERVAMNMPIQGTAADIIKIAMVKVANRLKQEKMQARLILQVHDELIVESPIEEAVKASQILKEEMENATKLAVSLTVDCNIGKTWYDAKG